MTSEELDILRVKKGLVATVVTSGKVEDAFAWDLMEVRSWCDRNDFHHIEWRPFVIPFVAHGRDTVLAHTLREGYDWCLQIDADAAPIQSDALVRILHTAFIKVPDADVVGAYAQLKQPPYLPTIDTGTGTWEPIFPGEGVIPVMRTGGHFLLVKPQILRRFGPPWFATRDTKRPIDALAELDNFARITFDGQNPLQDTEAWHELMIEAQKQGGGVTATVGEDSGFCDAVKAVGGSIYVDTNLVVGHIGKQAITPDMLKTEMKKREAHVKSAVGVYE